MENRKINILGFILLMLLVFVSFYLYKRVFVPTLPGGEISELKMTMMESRNVEKTVTGRDDINRFVSHFNALELEFTLVGSGVQAWKMEVAYDGEKEGTILVTTDRIRLNRNWYRADPEDLRRLTSLYEAFDYPVAETAAP